MRKLLVVGVALAIIGLAVMALPFGHPEPQDGPYHSTVSRCSAPVISAWHRDADAGWYGYVPLAPTPDDPFPTCKPQARRRLAGSLLFVACGVAVGIVAIRRSRPDVTETPADPGGIE